MNQTIQDLHKYVPQPSIPFTPQPLPEGIVSVIEELLRKAKEYDRITGQPDCELDSKKKILQELAEKLKITIRFPQ